MSVVHDALLRLDETKESFSRPLSGSGRNGPGGIFVFDLPNEIVNDFYDLREYIRIANIRNQMRVLSIASSVQGEGSSTIAAYLAALMSGSLNGSQEPHDSTPSAEAALETEGVSDTVFKADFRSLVAADKLLDAISAPSKKKNAEAAKSKIGKSSRHPTILLVDANLHQPGLHSFFDLDPEDGLAEVIEHQLDWRQYVRFVHGAALQVLTAGKSALNPADLLGSAVFRQLVQEWRDKFDYVIFDSPPVLPFVDSLSLAAIVDGVVLVVRAGQTRWEVAQNAKRRLVSARANLLGVALNRRKMGMNDRMYKRLA